jgi:hypothetical protein
MGVQTMAGRVQVCWETRSAATPRGQLAYFIEFLHLTGLGSRWLERCPLSDKSPNAPTPAEVLGTWLLSMLSGHRRGATRTSQRCAVMVSIRCRHAQGDLGRRTTQCAQTHSRSRRDRLAVRTSLRQRSSAARRSTPAPRSNRATDIRKTR